MIIVFSMFLILYELNSAEFNDEMREKKDMNKLIIITGISGSRENYVSKILKSNHTKFSFTIIRPSKRSYCRYDWF